MLSSLLHILPIFNDSRIGSYLVYAFLISQVNMCNFMMTNSRGFGLNQRMQLGEHMIKLMEKFLRKYLYWEKEVQLLLQLF